MQEKLEDSEKAALAKAHAAEGKQPRAIMAYTPQYPCRPLNTLSCSDQ